MDFSIVEKNLKDRGYTVTTFETAAEAVTYLDTQIDNRFSTVMKRCIW